ncbi:MAG: N-acetylmuramoyl-L-alanine amidase [Clostridia bacterium]|nr:N-acetylmuramoyl-L-alanine amidase [Clostridia bacterium]
MVIVLRKKAIFTLMAFLMLIGGVNIASSDESLQTSALPAANKVVILDAGHGGEDGGASGKSGIVEKDINLKVATKLQALLEQSGCTVITSRTEDISLHTPGEEKEGNRKISDLDNRKKISEKYQGDIFVSIHMNTYTDPKYKGAQVFYASDSPESQKLAKCVQGELKSQIDPENTREVKDANNGIYILSGATIPSIVAECGFLSNEQEEKLLSDENYQQKLAFAIYCGIIKYFTV